MQESTSRPDWVRRRLPRWYVVMWCGAVGLVVGLVTNDDSWGSVALALGIGVAMMLVLVALQALFGRPRTSR